jgi:hypothetical protein
MNNPGKSILKMKDIRWKNGVEGNRENQFKKQIFYRWETGADLRQTLFRPEKGRGEPPPPKTLPRVFSNSSLLVLCHCFGKERLAMNPETRS